MYIKNYQNEKNIFYLKKNSILRFITAGSVDDGKSTLIGRLLFDSKGIFLDQINSISSYKYSINNNIDLSLIVDGLESEIEQGITIDVAYRYFSTPKRKFIIADTPGHEQYTRNMITGASTADAVIILIDVTRVNSNKYGHIKLLTQTKRHSTIASLLNIKHIIIAVNKMDLVDYNSTIYNNIISAYLKFSEKLNIKNVNTIPLSALFGENVITRCNKNLFWYKGMSLIETLESLSVNDNLKKKPFRFPIQFLIKKESNKLNNFRGYMGQIKSGIVNIKDKLKLLPNGKNISIKNINILNKSLNNAYNGDSVTIFLNEFSDIARGDMLVSIKNTPFLLKSFKANLCWLSEINFNINNKYLLKHTTNQVIARILNIENLLNINNQKLYLTNFLKLNDIVTVFINIQDVIIADRYNYIKSTGSFIIIDENTNQTVAAGMIKF